MMTASEVVALLTYAEARAFAQEILREVEEAEYAEFIARGERMAARREAARARQLPRRPVTHRVVGSPNAPSQAFDAYSLEDAQDLQRYLGGVIEEA